MVNLMENLLGNNNNKSPDEMIAMQSMAAAAAASAAYLTATLEACTPEVRRLLSEYTTQSVMGHEVLTALTIKKHWYHPYKGPEQQLRAAVEEAEK